MPKISQLISATDVTANDLIQIVDVEDGGMAPSGTNKKVTASLLAKELAKQPLEPGVVISGSSSSDAVRITQTGAGNALVVEDSTNPDSTPFVITASGNVGIGTNNPDSKLEVSGNIASKTGSQFGGVVVRNANSIVGYIVGISATNDDGRFGLLSNNADKVMIQANGISYLNGGYVGIGNSGPQAKLHLSSPNADWEGGLMLENTVTNQKFVLSSRTDLSSPPRFSISNETRFNEDLSILASNGYVGIGVLNPQYQLQLALDSAAKPSTSTWTVSSDERLKENIEPADLDICYNAIKSIPLKRYKWKNEVYSDEQVSDRSKIGWIAQDVQAVFPKAVGQHKFVYNQVKDDDGNIVSEDSIDDCLSLNSDQLYAALFGAVQKLMVTVESLEDKIVQLESGS